VRQLLADIEAGEIDCVVVYQVDRLSRSLIDLARMMGLFEKHGVCFVSVTQQFNAINRAQGTSLTPCFARTNSSVTALRRLKQYTYCPSQKQKVEHKWRT
jgi:hypothetical protein